jgi:hypothetical protein
MYLRTIQRRNTDGTVVRYIQLAHNAAHGITPQSIRKGVSDIRIEVHGRLSPFIELGVGFNVDLSVCPQFDFSAECGPSFVEFDSRPFFLSDRLLEIPCTVDYTGWAGTLRPALHRIAPAEDANELPHDKLVDRRVERRQLEGLGEYCRVHPLEEKLDGRIVRVASNKNKPLSRSRSYPRDRPVKHLASHPRHHHVANDEIKGVLPDLAQALDAARD